MRRLGGRRRPWRRRQFRLCYDPFGVQSGVTHVALRQAFRALRNMLQGVVVVAGAARRMSRGVDGGLSPRSVVVHLAGVGQGSNRPRPALDRCAPRVCPRVRPISRSTFWFVGANLSNIGRDVAHTDQIWTKIVKVKHHWPTFDQPVWQISTKVGRRWPSSC